MTEPPVISRGSALVQSLFNFRNSLITLKEDRTTYIKSADVVGAYDQLCELLHTHEGRFGEIAAEHETSSLRTPEQQESEKLLDDCFQLISLLFLTTGRNNEPPATYAPNIITKRLLRHLTESDNFSNRDLAPLRNTLQQFKETISRNGSSYDLPIISFLDSRINACLDALKPLQQSLDQISPKLQGVYEKLVSLRRCIKAAEAKKKFSESEVKGYLDQIKQIEAAKINGMFVGEDGSIPEQGQERVQLVLSRCFATADQALKRQGVVAPSLSHLADELLKIKNKLEKLELTQAWSLRETDLYDFQVFLMDVDDQRVEGKFVGSDGDSPEEGQDILLYLLRRSYAHIYVLMSSSEPVSEALTPIFNQLQTVRRCLNEVQKFGIQDARELYPYSMKLSSIDNMKVDGKFMAGNDIPEGQGRVASLLAECFEICKELRNGEKGTNEVTTGA